MKKKESIKELLERLDNQSAQYSAHLNQANRMFETSVKKLERYLSNEKKELDMTLRKVHDVLKRFNKKKGK
jgi:hypothetical protein